MIVENEGLAEPGSEASHQGEAGDVHWISRKLRPITLLYVLLLFGAFITVSHFVFHSGDAVKALAIAAFAFIIALLPAILVKIEYRATDAGVEKRSIRAGNPGSYTDAFQWDELSHVVFAKNGFKYFKHMDVRNPILRFLYTQFSDKFSGEIHVEPADWVRVKALLAERDVTVRS